MKKRPIIARWLRLCGLLCLTACSEQGESAEPIEQRDAGEDAAIDGGEPRAPEAGGCDDRGCYCRQICGRGSALACPLDEGLESCLSDCTEEPAQCVAASLELLACQYALPEAAYSCDPIIESAVVTGCDEAKAKLETCSRR